MSKLLAKTVLVILVVACSAGIAEAKKWSGKWGGTSYTTLEFLDGNRVKYCFKRECVIKPYSGSPKKTIKFKWGNSSFAFEWNGQGYNGTFKNGNNRSTVLMK